MASKAHTTRRSLFAIAGAAALSGTPVAVIAGPAMPDAADAGLSSLIARWERALAHEAHADQALDLAHNRFRAELPKPPRLTFTAADAERSSHAKIGGHWDWKEVERIAREAKTRPDHRYPKRVKWMARFEKAVERHKAKEHAWDEECGYTAASDAWDAAVEEVASLERQIIAAPCRSMADARIKARVAMKNVDNDYGRDLAQQVAAFVLNNGLN